ncbi:MAG: hypothetical protein A2175_00020 [Candidatus Nealsonbacteria bacterium RBG_13_42_11]|uniref:Prepilin-type N-terminal cleavage/methylation domain-containing protein n=1 Tax=Candidatus Nealsonbacteria bacterium RBG_13_42_11 TaxID=1801663 RepID=A0A1G2DYN6_9BACT|nr:MAG: hypothetical protein A2175_00020 [Candidatus Nealsonbacteria bacterium RBG_13_42_11]
MRNKGYTLIEILVAISIFTTVIAAPTGFFVIALKGQQKALASQEVLDETSFVLEYVSRALRMAKKELSSSQPCLTNGYGFNYETTRDGNGIRFKSYKTPSVCQEIFLENGHLMETRDGGLTSVPLTSDGLWVEKFKINLIGESQSNPDGSFETTQPRVTLYLEVKGIKAASPELQPVLKIQTTISQRNLDVMW